MNKKKISIQYLQELFNTRRAHCYDRNLAGAEELAWNILGAGREGEWCECVRQVR